MFKWGQNIMQRAMLSVNGIDHYYYNIFKLSQMSKSFYSDFAQTLTERGQRQIGQF